MLPENVQGGNEGMCWKSEYMNAYFVYELSRHPYSSYDPNFSFSIDDKFQYTTVILLLIQ